MLRVNRILAAIATWINAVVWWHEGKTQEKPYETLYTQRVEGAGIAMLVRRNPDLCPRDVGTLMWMPTRANGPVVDVHLLIDHLDGMARKPKHHTHQITVALASHWPDEDGLYELEPLFFATADLQGFQPRRDLHVRKVLATLVEPLTFNDPPRSINWKLQLDIAMKLCGLTAPKLSGSVIAYDVATGQPLRIHLD